MLIGLVTDIHDHVEPLARALDLFRRRGVDQVITLGDSCQAFTRHSRAAEVVGLLRGANVIGVWGNHDMGLCHEVDERARQRYPAAVLGYLATMKPRLCLGECHFSHDEPSVDPYDAQSLWARDEDETLDLAGRARQGFAAVAQRLLFVGQYHRWLAVTEAGPLAWRGDRPLIMQGASRYLVIVGPVFQGHCAVLDTEQCELCPLPC
jgi:hypothetical protein